MINNDSTDAYSVSTNNLTVLILAAGYGRRMGPFTRMVNKGLIPYHDKPLISHIIERFPTDTKFVIACGHLGQQVRDYVGAVHAEKNVVFVDIPDYSEGNTGPATTIQHCAEHIKDGCLWLACDTLFEFNYADRLDHNWIGVYPVDSAISQDYCWVRRDGDDIVQVFNKLHNETAVDAFIGLMYAKDGEYLKLLQERGARETYHGFGGLDLKAHTVREWLDFGTYEKWQQHNRDAPENSFVKPDELFYHDNGKVIKYFSNADHVHLRLLRAQANPDCMPSNVQARGHFLIHDYAEGDIVYNQATPELLARMLDWCNERVWVPQEAPNNPAEIFANCEHFYKKKTIERVRQFRVKYADWSECCVVNRQEVDSIETCLSRIHWDWLCTETHWGFIHGDLHFDNTIYNADTGEFTAIDWRTDFAGGIYGDIYYDLAKLLGGIWLNYRRVKNAEYQYMDDNDYATITVPTVDNPEEYEAVIKNWVDSVGLNWRKVKTLVPLIYLNMAPLHEAPFDKFLIALAQLHFKQL